MKLEKCPCGKTPENIHTMEGSCCKHAFAYGSCCGDWLVEINTGYKKTDSKEYINNAIHAWNKANRK